MTERIALLAGAWLTACNPAEPVVEPPWPNYGVEEYGAECRALIGSVPAFDCMDGVIAEITVDGQAPQSFSPNMSCDRPALLPPDAGEITDGQCVPYSRAQVLRDDADVQIAAFCRKKLIRPADSPIFDEVDVILHSVATGTTCWFQADPPNPTGDPALGIDVRHVPSPTLDASPGAPPATAFWNRPYATASKDCGGCHDNDPFYYSPFVGQTGQLPSDPLGHYNNAVGPMTEWQPLVALSTRGNTCVGCHRIGSDHTCDQGLLESVGRSFGPGHDAWAQAYPQSHWMPIDNSRSAQDWEVAYQRSVDELLRCCKQPTAAGCDRAAID